MPHPVSGIPTPHHHAITHTDKHDVSKNTFSEKIHSSDSNHALTLEKKIASPIKIPKEKNVESSKTEIKQEIKNIFLYLISINYQISSLIKVFQEFHKVDTAEIKDYHVVTKLISKASSLAEEIGKMPEFKEVLTQMRSESQVIQNLHNNQIENEKNKTKVKAVVQSIMVLRGVNDLASRVSKFLENFFPISSAELKEYQKITSLLTDSLKKIKFISEIINLVNDSKLLKMQKKELANIDRTLLSSSDVEKINKIEEEIKKLSFNIDKMNENLLFKTIYLIPEVADNIYSYVRHFGKVKDIAPISTGIFVAGNIAEVVSAGHDVYKKNQLGLAHEYHVADLQAPVVDLVQSNTPTQYINDIKDFENATQKKVITLFYKRKINFEKRMEIENQRFENLLKLHAGDFAAFKKAIPLPENINSFAAITPKIRSEIVKERIEIKDTMTRMAKDQLKARLNAQEQINHKFFNFKRNASIIKYGVTVISCITAVILTILMPVVALPPLLFMIPVAMGIASSYGLIALGAYHLNQTKPNLAKVYLSFDRIGLALNKIPLTYAEYKLKSLKENQDQTYDYWKKETEYYQNKAKSIEDKILQARKDDFEETGFKSFTNDEFKTIAESLITGEFWNDPESSSFLKKYTGVEFNDSGNPIEKTEILSQKLKTLVLRNSKATLKWLELQSIKEIKI